MTKPIPTPPTTVFYDGACAVCVHQMHYYSSRDRRGNVRWIDISAPDFSAVRHGLDAELVKKHMYASDAEGRVVRGVEAFIWIWRMVGWRALPLLVSLPLVRELAKIFYALFARFRYGFGRQGGGACARCRVRT